MILIIKTSEGKMIVDIQDCDILITAMDKPDYFNLNNLYGYCLYDTIAIDVGIIRCEDGKLHGNISRSLYPYFKRITPVPNGVGVTTVLSVIENIVELYERRNGELN